MRGDIRRVLGMATGCLLAALAHSGSPTHRAHPDPAFHQEVRNTDVYIETYVTGYNTVAAQTDGAPCFGDLLGDPLGGWICCHTGPDEPSSLQTQDDQPVEHFEPDRRNDEQIDAGDVGGVIAQESLPARRARAVTP